MSKILALLPTGTVQKLLGQGSPTLPMGTPDITAAQITAFITFVVGQLVAYGLIDNSREQVIISVGTLVLGVVLHFADAIIRHGRATGAGLTAAANAQLTAAAIAEGVTPPGRTSEAAAERGGVENIETGGETPEAPPDGTTGGE